MPLYSETIFAAIKTAMEGITILSGSGAAPKIVQRFDKERRQTGPVPGIQIRRLDEQHSNPGTQDRLLDEQLSVVASGELVIYSALDRDTSETYDELVAADVADVLAAFYAIDWDELKANPDSPLTWRTLAAESEDEPDDGALIRFNVTYRSPKANLQEVEGRYNRE